MNTTTVCCLLDKPCLLTDIITWTKDLSLIQYKHHASEDGYPAFLSCVYNSNIWYFRSTTILHRHQLQYAIVVTVESLHVVQILRKLKKIFDQYNYKILSWQVWTLDPDLNIPVTYKLCGDITPPLNKILAGGLLSKYKPFGINTAHESEIKRPTYVFRLSLSRQHISDKVHCINLIHETDKINILKKLFGSYRFNRLVTRVGTGPSHRWYLNHEWHFLQFPYQQIDYKRLLI